jgi:hypothetical protein
VTAAGPPWPPGSESLPGADQPARRAQQTHSQPQSLTPSHSLPHPGRVKGSTITEGHEREILGAGGGGAEEAGLRLSVPKTGGKALYLYGEAEREGEPPA